jgi:hypothetical protein
VAIHLDGATKMAGDFQSFVNDLVQLVANYENHLRAQALGRAPLRNTQSSPRPMFRSRSGRRL